MKLALIMLAAGNSRRFGSNKLFYPIEGKAMYLHILEKLFLVKERIESTEITCSVTVVTQYSQIAEKAVRLGAKVQLNPHPEEGISSSLKLGLNVNEDADACLFTVSDQPWISQETILEMILKFVASEKGMACLWSDTKPGNPCIFSKCYYPELLSLEGDTGGKRIMKLHKDDVLRIPVTDARQLTDLDTCPEKEK